MPHSPPLNRLPDPIAYLTRSSHLDMLPLPTAHCSHPQPLPPLLLNLLSQLHKQFLPPPPHAALHMSPAFSLQFMTRDANKAAKLHPYLQILCPLVKNRLRARTKMCTGLMSCYQHGTSVTSELGGICDRALGRREEATLIRVAARRCILG